MVPDLACWLAIMRQIHETSIDRRLARETAMLERRAASVPIQPGLFDRRALRSAEDLSGRERAIDAEHRRQIAALDRARRLNLSCHAMAALIVWR